MNVITLDIFGNRNANVVASSHDASHVNVKLMFGCRFLLAPQAIPATTPWSDLPQLLYREGQPNHESANMETTMQTDIMETTIVSPSG